MYEVGQVLYVLMKKEHSVIPVRVVEKILRKTLDGESISYIVELPTSAQDQVDLEKLGTGIYSSSTDAATVMIENAKSTISEIISKAENISRSVFNVAPQSMTPEKQTTQIQEQSSAVADINNTHDAAASFQIGEHMEIDLGQGVKGKINMSGLET